MDMRSIGFFDSGIGGVSVLNATLKILPNENYIYFGDNLNAPYGNKSAEEIYSLSYNAVKKLSKYNVKAIVIACNTVSTNCLELLSHLFDVKLIPTLPPIPQHCGKTAVFCTQATADSGYFNNYGEVDVYPLPYLAGDIEDNISNLSKIDLSKHLPKLKKRYDNVVLGCTHYSFIADKFRLHFKNSAVIDGSAFAAERLYSYLNFNALQSFDKGGNVVFLRDVKRKNETAYNFIRKSEQTF